MPRNPILMIKAPIFMSKTCMHRTVLFEDGQSGEWLSPLSRSLAFYQYDVLQCMLDLY